MNQASRDSHPARLGRNRFIGTPNTACPVLVRGRADDGKDLVISRDYISMGLRARAGDLVTRELGPRSELEVRQRLEGESAAERWTRLDRCWPGKRGRRMGVIDLRPDRAAGEIRCGDPIGENSQTSSVGSRRACGAGAWILAADAEQRLRDLGERGDIIKRLHNPSQGWRHTRPASWALEGESHGEPITGRLIARGSTMNCGYGVRRRCGSMGASTTSSSRYRYGRRRVRSRHRWNYAG